MESKTVRVSLLGRDYDVPGGISILDALAAAGLSPEGSAKCGSGVCGGCAAVYSLNGKKHACLACRTEVSDGMRIEAMPGFPHRSGRFDFSIMAESAESVKTVYPEVASCIGCRKCDHACPKGIDVSGSIAAINKDMLELCFESSFSCVVCGACESVCPMGIAQPSAMTLARRLYAKRLSEEEI